MKFLQNYWQEFRKLDYFWQILIALGILSGSIIRGINLFNLGFLFDMVTTQYTWGKAGFEMGYFGFWANYIGFFDYLPLSLLLEIILYTLSLPFGGTAQNFVTAMKLMNWVVEIVLSLWVIGLSLKQGREESSVSKNQALKAFLAGLLVYILPSLWFVSGVWGQNDSLIVLLTFWSVTLMYKESGLNKVGGGDKESKHQFLTTIPGAQDSALISPKEPFYKNKYFLSGLVLGLAIWIKQQAILVFPVLIVYHLVGKSWKDIRSFVLLTIPFVITFLVGFRFYENGQWILTASLGAVIIVGSCLLQFVFINKLDNWRDFRRQMAGFILPALVITIPLLFVNYERTGSTTFAVLGRTDLVANGGATFWTALNTASVGSHALLNFGIFELSVSLAGYFVYIFLMGLLVWRIFDLNFKKVKTMNLSIIFSKSLSLMDFSVLMFVNTSAYFLFFTKMYSRYLHFGIIFSLIVLGFLNRTRFWKNWFWALLILHLGYFLNQVAMYSVPVFDMKSEDPAWVYDFLKGLNFAPWSGSAVISLVGFVLLYSLCLQIYGDPQNSKIE